MRRWLDFPIAALLYVLVYWNRTGTVACLAAAFAFDSAWPAAGAVVFAAFGLGLTTAELGFPKGKRR